MVDESPHPETDTGSPAAARADASLETEGFFRRILLRLSAVFRFGTSREPAPAETSDDPATRLAQQRTDLAMERNYYSVERTQMAWIRTALSMISFGFTIGKLGQVIKEVTIRKLLGGVRTVSLEGLAFFFVTLGTAGLLASTLQHWHRLQELRRFGLRRQISISFWAAVVLVVIGLLALTALILSL